MLLWKRLRNPHSGVDESPRSTTQIKNKAGDRTISIICNIGLKHTFHILCIEYPWMDTGKQ